MRELTAREGKAVLEAEPEKKQDKQHTSEGNQNNIAIGRLYGASGRKIAEDMTDMGMFKEQSELILEMANEYYQKFTGAKREDPRHYDMVVNVGKTGVDGALRMILDYVEKKEV